MQQISADTVDTFFMSSIFVTGIWGIFLGELQGVVPIGIFLLSSIILFIGIALDAAFNKDTNSDLVKMTHVCGLGHPCMGVHN